jgi:hypothetical protein
MARRTVKLITSLGTLALRAGPSQTVIFFVPKKSPACFGRAKGVIKSLSIIKSYE